MNRFLPVVIVITLSFLLAPLYPVHAVISSCGASVGITSVQANTTQSYSFTVSNDSENTISWIQVAVPSSNFTMVGGVYTPSGWSGSADSSTLTVTGGSLGSGGSYTFSIQTTSADVNASSANWSVQASDDGGGSDPTGCSGSLGTEITGSTTDPNADTTAPSISSLVVSDITDTSAKITWTTDESSSTSVDYGGDESYGSTATGDGNTTSHSVTISGLTANTTYHYDISSSDSTGNTANSGDNTFSTAKSGYTGTTVTGTVTTTTITRTVGPSPTPTPVPDRSPPVISITTKLEKVYTAPPQIDGRASDPSGVASVEYSLDGGISFLPVDELTSPGKTSTTFHLIPYQTDDGNYSLVLRSSDAKGNTGKSKSVSIVIDRIPPQFGTFLVSAGPQSIDPQNDTTRVLQGIDYQFTVSAVGGPVTMKLTVENEKREVADVACEKNPDTGLWRAPLHFDIAGTYTIYGNALDGAENKTVKKLANILVEPSGVIRNASGTPIGGAIVSLYVLDTHSKQFVLWDGSSYGQSHPYVSGRDGRYGAIVPRGEYYLTVRAPSYRTLRSDIFTVSTVSSVASNLSLEQKRGIRIGDWLLPLFDFSQTRTVISVDTPLKQQSVSTDLKRVELPFFRFKYGSGYISSLDLRGKPVILSFFNTWAPASASELAMLNDIASMPEIIVVGIIPQESVASVSTFAKRGGYAVKLVADPDGELVEPLHIGSSPTHVIVNRKGIIQSVIQGLVTKEDLLHTIIE